jgi:hypothetical protein
MTYGHGVITNGRKSWVKHDTQKVTVPPVSAGQGRLGSLRAAGGLP